MALNFSDKTTLFQLRLANKIDARMTACRVTAERDGARVRVSGYTQYRQTDAFVRTVAAEVFGEGQVDFTLRVLERGAPKFGVVRVAFAQMWRSADDTNPKMLDTQALYGTVVRVYQREGKFTLVQHPDGYVGYMPTEEFTPVTVADYLRWKNQAYGVTLVPLKAEGLTVPPGARLSLEGGRLVLPGGGLLRAAKKDFVAFDPVHSAFIQALEERAEEFMASPYLWGGKSELGIDCSGFVQTLALQQGIFLPRDASMQCHVGEMVGYLPKFEDLLPGDVMFFMNKNAFVFHVGIYLGNHMYMHSAGKTGPTKSSVFPKGENYMGRYGSTFVYARRIKL